MARYQFDKLAYEWDLKEDASKQMQEVLPFQTSHYAATQGVKTGKPESVPATPAAAS